MEINSYNGPSPLAWVDVLMAQKTLGLAISVLVLTAWPVFAPPQPQPQPQRQPVAVTQILQRPEITSADIDLGHALALAMASLSRPSALPGENELAGK